MARKVYKVILNISGERETIVVADDEEQAENIAFDNELDALIQNSQYETVVLRLKDEDLSEYSDDLDSDGIPNVWKKNLIHSFNKDEQISLEQALNEEKQDA